MLVEKDVVQIEPVDHDDEFAVQELVARVQNGDPDEVSYALTALRHTFNEACTQFYYRAKKSAPRLHRDDLSSSLIVAIYQAALEHDGERTFLEELDPQLKAATDSFLKGERKFQRSHGTFSEREERIGDDANLDDFLEDSAAAAPDESIIDGADELVVDSESEEVVDLVDLEGLRNAATADTPPIFGSDFPLRDHIVYHLGGVLRRDEMIALDLANGFTTGREIPTAELAEILGIASGSVGQFLRVARDKITPFEDELRDGRVPVGCSLEQGDPFYSVLEKVAASRCIPFGSDSFELFELTYPMLSEDTIRKLDQLRGVIHPYSVPTRPRDLARDWSLSDQQFGHARKKLAVEALNLMELARRNQSMDDDDYPYWLVKPGEVTDLFFRIDSGNFSIADGLHFLLPKMGHRPYRNDRSGDTPNTKYTVRDAREWILLDDRKLQPQERSLAVGVLTAALLASPESGFGRALRACPELFEGLMEKLSSRKMTVARRARELEDLGELTYERLGNLHRRWCGQVTYQTLVNFAKHYGLDVTPVHSPLDKPRLAREIVKRARPFEAEMTLSFERLRAIVTDVTAHVFSDAPVYAFAERKGLRLLNPRRTGVAAGVVGLISPEQEPQILEAARELESERKLTPRALNDIIFRVTGNRYSTAASLDRFIAKHDLSVIYERVGWQTVNTADTAMVSTRVKAERLNLSAEHEFQIFDEAKKFQAQGLLTPRRFNAIIHKVSGKSYEREANIRKQAKKQRLTLVDEPATILLDVDRGLSSVQALREAAADHGLSHKELHRRREPGATDGWEKTLERLVLEEEPALDGFVFDKPNAVFLLAKALATTTETKVGRELRTQAGFQRFEVNLARCLKANK